MNNHVVLPDGTIKYLDTPFNRWCKFILSLPVKTALQAVDGMLFYYSSLNQRDEIVNNKISFLRRYISYMRSVNHYNMYLKTNGEFNLGLYSLVGDA